MRSTKSLRIALLFTVLSIAASLPCYDSELTPVPKITALSLVAPDIISLSIKDGIVQQGKPTTYTPQPSDKIVVNFPQNWLFRDGTAIGAVAGRKKDIFMPFDKVVRGTLDPKQLQNPKNFQLISTSDPTRKTIISPSAIYRKSFPNNMGRTGPWDFVGAYSHTIYLKLPKPLKEGSTYALTFSNMPMKPYSFTIKSTSMQSEAIHISQIGFRPDDPEKVAFLSCWMGDGGGLSYKPNLPFLILDTNSGKSVYKSKFALSKAANDKTEDVYNRNYNLTDVYMADFASLKQPGHYTLVVPGIGRSMPFTISPNVWQAPFRTSVRGLFHQRSGITLGPPYTKFIRPRDFNPDDGVKVYASTTSIFDTGDGPLGNDIEPTNFANLVKGKTDTIVPNAWGGYHDAGDWDRRIQHLISTRNLLDLVEMFPKFSSKIGLNIPESGNKLPDMLDEALFGLDVYRRLQTAEGGIRGGIESEEHPRHGETSWQESLTVMTYAPDVWSSYLYAGTAARAAHVLEAYDPTLANEYRASALRAMAWANAQPESSAKPADMTVPPNAGYPVPLHKYHLIRDAKNYAAAELFRLTDDKRWNELFKSTTVLNKPNATLAQWLSHDQSEAAWVYVRTDATGVDKRLKDDCLAAIKRTADERLAGGQSTAFRWTKYPWRPFGIGIPATPDATNMIWAHYLTKDPKYLSGIILAAQFGAGANPTNICLTTGVGQVYPKHPLHVDSRTTGQTPPEGITVLGPFDVTNSYFEGDWGRKLLGPYCYPDLQTWPSVETYMDIFWNALLCEFTIHDSIAPNLYCWGYLAARR